MSYARQKCICVAAILAAALSSTGAAAAEVGGSPAAGKRLFVTDASPACALCHTLKDAGATGAIGPSLDEIRPDESRVMKAIRNGIGAMPAYSSLSEEDVRALAWYVAQATGVGK